MKRNKFSLSHYKLLTCDQGELVPIACFEVLPGDTVQHQTAALIRVSPLLAPVMHPVHARIHHWFVPYRLIWDNFENFITGGPDGMDASVYPTKQAGNAPVGSLADYLGLPTGVPGLVGSALPFRAYALIWNEWYRDQDLQNPLPISTGDGNDAVTNVLLQNCAWEKDYYTSARPWPQKGPAVTLPLGLQAPVTGIAVAPTTGFTATPPANSKDSTGANVTGSNWQVTNTAGAFLIQGNNTTKVPNIFADLSGATSVSVNELREALALQRYAEARARYGSRYTEYLRYLGVRSSDARLQRPEYLGGGRQTIQFSEVLQTGVTTDGDDTDGVGNLKGHGLGAMRSNRYRRFFEEHGIVISLLSVKPRTMYAQGAERMWNRRTKEDFYQKELEHIGQQEVLNKEIYAAHAQPNGVFGYQDRYDEYRRVESKIAGEFRTTALDFWHMARIFGSAPTLNGDFVKSNPTKRVYAEQTQDSLWIMANHSIQARRMLSRTGSSFTF